MNTRKNTPPDPQVTFSRNYTDMHLPNSVVYLKKKLNHEDAGWLYIRASLKGQRVERSLGIKIKEADWDPINQCMPRNMQITRQIWDAKEKFTTELVDALHYAEQHLVSSPDIRLAAEMTAGRTLSPELMSEVFQLEIARMKEKKGEGFSKANIQKHSVCLRHFSEFLSKYYKQNDVQLKHINKKMIQGFIDYLKTDVKNGHNSSMKIVQILKKIYRIALDNMWVDHNPFAGIKINLKTVNRDFLDEDELHTVAHHHFTIPRLAMVRDYFIFSCYTGLAYIDLMYLKRNALKEYLGRTWINMERVKTQVSASIPLLAPARIILERYRPDWKTLPAETKLFKQISNQKLNSYLKEIITICGIEKQISFHISRHTFASTVNGLK
jgi:site-specific recombinase XerD